MRARLIRIGNSRGIRIPKPLLEQVGLRDTVQIRAEKGRLVILPDKAPRQGWAEAFQAMADRGDDRILPDQTTNAFDTKEWKW
jgi:antitoxin MazE